MDGHADFRKWFAYEDWANREVLRSLRACATVPPRALAVLAHIVGVQRLYLGRLEQDGLPVVVWPMFTLDQCQAGMDELGPRWRDYLGRLSPDDLDRAVPYTNSLGESWQNSVRDMLAHVVLHGSYHRGQIATLLGSSGQKAPYTDFIHCVRQGFVTPE
jgi:uncharacterized damage-inducible protein DinB